MRLQWLTRQLYLKARGWKRGCPDFDWQTFEQTQLDTDLLGSIARQTRPAHETKGLLLLSPEEISTILSKEITLGQYLDAGGKALLRVDLPLNGRLQPFPHLRLLHWVLTQHPEILS